MKPPETEELSENIEVVTPGDMLKEARMAAQLSILDVSKKLHLRESLIEAIEANEFDEIPSVTFTRGYLKGYAKLLSISESDVLEAFEYLNTFEQNQLEMQSFSNRSSQKAADNWLTIVTLLVGLVIVVLAVVWWWQKKEPQDVSTAPAQAVSTPQNSLAAEGSSGDDNTTPEQADAPSPGGQDDAPQGNLPEIDDAPAVDPGQSVGAGEQPASDNSASGVEVARALLNEAPGEQKKQSADNTSLLELHFSDSCWINVSDATGQRIAIGTKVQGHVTRVRGIAPFTIKLGKPDVVTVFLNGEEKKIPYYPKGSVANFVLSDDN